VIVVFENQDYSAVIGNSAMPYFNNLAQQNSLATQFFANAHPSITDYFMMTTGKIVSMSNDFPGTFDGDTVTRELSKAGKTWKVYAGSLPAVGYIGSDQYPYVKHHNPFVYFDDVLNDPAQRNNIVPLAQLLTDNGANALPNYSFVVPDNLHNGHDCPAGGSVCAESDRLGTIDGWLQANIGPLVDNPEFMNNGVLIITFDESVTDNTMGGGRIPTVLVGGKIKAGFQSTTTYQFPSLLRFSLKSLGIGSYPGAASDAPDMDEFVQ
jgi:acid phosphatase